jgi:hypothetical protein
MTRTDFALEPWEIRVLPGQDRAGAIVAAKVDHIWTETTDNVVRFYGSGERERGFGMVDHLWLRPQDVPTRVLRGDTGTPTHPDEWHRIFAESRARWQADRERKPTDDEKLAARLVPIEPEVRARPATLEEIPRGAKTVGVKATKAGFEVDARYARGPRFDQYWNFVEMSPTIMIRGKHADGRRFGAMWLAKTGESGASAGVVKWGLENSHIYRSGYGYENGQPYPLGWQPCNATELSAYLLTSE